MDNVINKIFDIGTTKDIIGILQSTFTVIAIVVGGIWTYFRYIRQGMGLPRILLSADIRIHGIHEKSLIVELFAFISNKGYSRFYISSKDKFTFTLKTLSKNDNVNVGNDKASKPLEFSGCLRNGNWIEDDSKYYFVDPGTTIDFSHITKIPTGNNCLLLDAYLQKEDSSNFYNGRKIAFVQPLPEDKKTFVVGSLFGKHKNK